MVQFQQNIDGPHEHAALRAMFAARKSVFVDLLKWDIPVLAGKYEIDMFDNDYARYLILTDPEGRHLGSARLLPTLRPHILDSLYTALCAGPLPRGEHIYEITRFCLDRHLRAADRRLVRDRLVMALVDYALVHGIETYTAIAEHAWLRKILSFGWSCAPLGGLYHVDRKPIGALRIEITPDTPYLLATTGVILGSPDHLHDIRVAA